MPDSDASGIGYWAQVRRDSGGDLVTAATYAGAYLFAPSLPALEKIAALAHQPRESADAAQGETIVKTLLYLESVLPAETVRDAWKAYLEDLGSKEKGYSNAIWAAIRGKFGRGSIARAELMDEAEREQRRATRRGDAVLAEEDE